ncbi:MAG: DUF4340 domain-containing protein [Candidatus Binatia bacterium]
MGWRGTVILALLVLALGTYLWFEPAPPRDLSRPDEVAGEVPTREPTKAMSPLLDFTAADVAGIRFERGGRALETERAGGNWQETEPPGAIEDFLRTLGQMSRLAEMPTTGAELKDYGLQQPRETLQLRLRHQAEPLVLQIGDHNPATTGVYVRVGNGPVLLAGALLDWEFDKAFKAVARLQPGG